MDPNSNHIDVEDFNRWQISRRKLLMSGVVAGAAVLGRNVLSPLARGLTREEAPTAAGATSLGLRERVLFNDPTAVRSGGLSLVPTPRNQTVVIDQGVFSVYDSFNPLIPNGEQYQAGIAQLCKEYLWYLNMATGKLQDWQGESWSYNSTYTQCTLKLKPNVTWSDGKPFTSADVAFTTELMKKNQSVIGGDSNATWTPQVVSVDTPDAQTAVFNLSARNTRFHYNFICQIISAQLLVLPEHIWSGQDITTFKNDPPIFTGPYTLQKTIADLGLFIWEKAPNYWAKATMDPAAPYVVFRNAPTDADLENEEFKQGLIDYNNSSTSYEYGTILQDGGDKDVVICNFLDSDQRCIFVNDDPSRGALADPKFRYALSMLINRQKVIANIWPVPTTVDIYPWPNYPNLDPWENKAIAAEFAQYREYNPTMSAQFLDELGIKVGSGGKRYYRGKQVTMDILSAAQLPSDPEYIVGELLVEELEQLGISSSLKAPTSAVYSDLWESGEWDLRTEWLGGTILDPWQGYNIFNSKYNQPIGKLDLVWPAARLDEPSFDATVNKLADLDPTAASSVSTYNEALKQWFTYLPAIPYIQTVYWHVSSTQYWTGWPTNKDLYQIPSNWWGQFLFVIGNLKPAAS
jgi:peptide/nickel transport system substrate-binding protein